MIPSALTLRSIRKDKVGEAMNEQRVLKQFAEQITMQFDVYAMAVYREREKVYGTAMDDVTIDRCLALTCTSIFKEQDASLFATHIYVGSHMYMILLQSHSSSAFDGLDARYIIDEAKRLQKRLGDMA